MFKQLMLPPIKPIFILILLLVLSENVCGISGNSKKSAAIEAKYSSQKVSRGFDVNYYKLFITIDTARKFIGGRSEVHFSALVDLDSIELDLFAQYEIHYITKDSVDIGYRRAGNKIYIDLPGILKKGTSQSITVNFSGKPQSAVKPPWDGGFIWAKDSSQRTWIGVACEQLGASSWWPCKDDWSDEPDSMTIFCNVPKELTVVCNGNLVEVLNGINFRAYRWHVSYPINLYNITLNIGHYKQFTDTFTSVHKDANGKNITYPVDYYFLDYNLNKAKAFFADSIYARTKTMLQIFEKRFGVYPFYNDGYALVETPYWGMEHQSAVAYGNNFKLNAYGFDFILIHESGHEWWGNAVSAYDAGDMWLHESFTTYSEALYVEYLQGYGKSIQYLEMQKFNIANKNPVQGPRDVHFHDRSDNDIYYKGSWMLHTLRSTINNDSLWFSILYGLQQEFRYKTIATEDVIAYMEKHTGRNLKPFFAQYLYESKLPTLQCWIQTRGRKSRLKYRWLRVVEGFNMPVEVEVNGKKYLLNPTKKFKHLKLEIRAHTNDIKVDTGRFLVKVLTGI